MPDEMSTAECEKELTRFLLSLQNDNPITYSSKTERAIGNAASVMRKVAARELVPLPPPETNDYKGLKVKYRGFKASDNSAVEGCFILRPEKDPAARAALFHGC